MLISLNQLVQMTSDLANKPFSVPLQEELKFIYNYKRADWMQKIIEKYPQQRRYFLKYITAELELVDKAECPVNLDCQVLRTVQKIPLPLRTSWGLFDSVGDPDKLDGYTYTGPEHLVSILRYGSKYTKERPKYNYQNGYVYIYNEDTLEYISIAGIWFDQRQLHPFKCNDQPCYTDNDQYDIADDIINTMVQDVIKNELRLLLSPEQAEVTTQKEN